MAFREEDLPALYHDGNDNSINAQDRFLKWTRRGLVAVIIAAAAGSVNTDYGDVDIGGIVAVIAFCAAILWRIFLLRERPEKIWYDGRAVAESAKTSAWRYAVCGEPFKKELAEKEADERFIQRLREIPSGLDSRSIIPSSENSRRDITEGMRELRKNSLEERKNVYQECRIKDQRDWYSRKSKWNEDRAKSWNVTLISIEIVGVVGAVLKAVNLVDIGALGFAGAVVAAGTSWLQTKQHANLAEAYAVAARELSYVDTLLPSCTTEKGWSEFVGQAEEAISREHTLWVASRTSNRALSALYRDRESNSH